VFVNPLDKYFVLMSDKPGRYALSGECKIASKKSNTTSTNYSSTRAPACKLYRLLIFSSSSMTNNEINVRIYVISSMNSALTEVLCDENKLGGHMLSTSEPFLLSIHSSNLSETLSLCIDEMWPEGLLSCKYNVNFQVYIL
jgi:hypothetical protein